jgi:ATP sulfurylase
MPTAARQTWPACSFKGCTHPAFCKGLCGTHYQQQRRSGALAAIRPRVEAGVRLPRVVVGPEVAAKLESVDGNITEAIRVVLTRWASREGKARHDRTAHAR